jgi:hypothetical protein
MYGIVHWRDAGMLAEPMGSVLAVETCPTMVGPTSHALRNACEALVLLGEFSPLLIAK